MPDLRISELQTLAGANLAAADYLPLADISASESKKITVTDFLGYAVTLIADSTIPSGKIIFNNNTVPGAALIGGSVTATQLANDTVTAAKMADSSSVQFVATLPASGAFIGQLAVDIATLATYAWNGSTWQSIKAAGSINTVIGGTAGVVNVTTVQSGSSVTINTTLDNTTAAAQFLAGPSGSAGAVSYRLIAAADLPTATSAAKGAVRVSGSGLTMSGDQLQINNTVAANTSVYHLVRYDANGLVTGGRLITSGDLPAAAAGSLGAVYPGSGLSVSTGGQLNHTNAATPGTYPKVTIDAQGHVTLGTSLQAADIPNLDTSVLTSGQLPTDRIANDAVTGAKLANSSVTQFGGPGSTSGITVFPVAEFTGQYFFDRINGDLYLWDSNVWQPITITSGEIVFAGTFNASLGGGVGQVASVTAAGAALGLTVGGALPAASANNNRYYVVVSVNGTITSGNAPSGALAAPDMILSNGTAWQLVKVSTTVAGVTQASGITFTPAGNITANNVQAALTELDSEKLAVAGGTITGEVLIGPTGALAFEGATTNAFQTYITVTDPTTADRTITLPDRSGTVITTGDTGTVTNTMLAGSIALSKLVALTSGNIIVGSAANVPTAVAVSGDITISNAGVVDIAAGAIVNADISASAAIAFSKLAPLNSGSILVGNVSNVATAVIPTGDVTITNAGVTSIAAGVIVDADINASAAIAGTKISPNFGAQTVTTTGIFSAASGSAATPSVTFTSDTSSGLSYSAGIGIGVSIAGVQRALFTGGTFDWGAPTGDCGINIGKGATASRAVYLDLVGDTTYTDYGLRLVRYNTGPNANSQLVHRGTGGLYLSTTEAGPVIFQTAGLERARITADGNLALGSVGAAGLSFQNAKPLTGATTTYGQLNQGVVQSDCTSAAVYYASTAQTQAAAFTLNNLYNFLAQQSTIGAGSTVTNQFGFAVSSNLTGATTNVGFHSAIPSGTGRWNFYAAGTADSYFASNNFIFANGGTERARIDSFGRLLVGTSSSITAVTFPAQVQTNSFYSYSASLFSADATGSNFLFLKSRNATTGSHTVVQANDVLGQTQYAGSDGTAFITGAAISAVVDGTPGLNDMPGRLIFSTTPAGSVNPVERMRIKSTGTINFSNVATYADNTAATAGGLAVGDVYRTATGQLMIRY